MQLRTKVRIGQGELKRMPAILKPFPQTWERDDWLKWRREGCGGSDVAAICGLSTFASPMATYFDKLGLLDDEPENESMRWGRLLETPILAEFEAQTDLFVVEPQALACDPDHPHRRVTLDGLVVDSRAEWENAIPPHELILGVIEAKTTGDYSWDDDHGGIPDRVALQVQWQLGVCRFERAWLAVLHQGRRFRIYEIDADPKTFDALCAIVDRFWNEHVLGRVPPPADSNTATTAALKAAFRDAADGATVRLDDAALAAAREWLPAKQLAKETAAYVDLIENQLRAALGDAVEGHDELGSLVSWKPQQRVGQLDGDRLKAERPDVYAEYVKPATKYRVLRPAKALRALAEKVAS